MVGSSLIVTLLTLSCGLISVLNQAVLAKMFGASVSMDSFLAATSIPTFVSGALCAAMSYTITPHLVDKRLREKDEYPGYCGMFQLSLLALCVLLFMGGFLCSRMILRALMPGVPDSVLAAAVTIAKVSWITGIVATSMVYLTSVLNVADSFVIPAAVGTLPYMFMTGFTLWLGPRVGPLAVALGLLFGTAAAVLPLGHFASRSIRLLNWWPSRLPEILRYARQMPIFILAMLCFTAFQSVDSFWGTRLGVGNLATLGYSQRILVAVGNLVISGPSAVLMPKLSTAFIEQDSVDFLALVLRIVRLVIACAAFVAVSVSLLSVPVIRLLFARGAFDGAAVARLAGILPLMLAGMVAMLTVVMLFRVLFAQRSVAGPAAIGLLCASSYFTLSWGLSSSLGLRGIGFAYILSWTLGLISSLLLIWRRHFRLLLSMDNFIFIGQILATLVVVAALLKVLLLFALGAVQTAHGLRLLSWTLMLGMAGFLPFWGLTVHIFRIPELVMLNELIMAKLMAKFRAGPARQQ